MHTVSVETTYYYRILAHDGFGSCDVSGGYSATLTVVVEPIIYTRIITGVVSAQGGNGSDLKTDVQIEAPTPQPVSGRIIFHPAGVSGNSSDRSMTYSVDPGKLSTFRTC